MNILLTGRPGTGKTWVMNKLIEHYECTQEGKTGLINYRYNSGGVIITGNYDGTTFEGGDRLSMAAISSVGELIETSPNGIRIFDGDRFTNKTMLQYDPIVINIRGDGAEGRKMRGSNQTEARLKSMKTRYNSYDYTYRVDDSNEALELLKSIINGEITEHPKLQSGVGQANLFNL